MTTIRKNSDYTDFINDKQKILESAGIDIDTEDLNPKLYDFQKDIVRWSLAKGKSAIFADCGLGKTAMQLEWAYQVSKYTGGKVLILAPLAVASQTANEGKKFDIDVTICESQLDVRDGINISNYEKLNKFVANEFVGIVLDESSILKSFTGKTKTEIIQAFSKTPYRLACTATPAPNDYMELGNHSEFLGIMSRTEMLSMYFIHDGSDTSKWRLKGHAEDIFWNWMCSWACFIDNPSNLGYEVAGYDLPKLNIIEVIADGEEFTNESLTLTQRRQVRKDTLDIRCKMASDIINKSNEQWLIWCNLNDESSKLKEYINNSIEVKGSDKNEHKSKSMLGFADGTVQNLVTKPSIAGFGMNWQNCHNMVFVGLSDSYEQFYQALRRCYRFGQEKEVNAYIIMSSREGSVMKNIERKQADADKMRNAMAEFTKEITKKELTKTYRITTEYNPTVDMILPDWKEMKKAC